MAGAATTAGAAAYAGCRIGAAKGGGLKTVDIVKKGQIARRSAEAGNYLLPGRHWDGYIPWFRDQFEDRTRRPFKHNKAKYGALAAGSVEHHSRLCLDMPRNPAKQFGRQLMRCHGSKSFIASYSLVKSWNPG